MSQVQELPKRGGMDRDKKLDLNIKGLNPGDHLCCLYRTEDEHRAVIKPYLTWGIKSSHKILYITDNHTEEQIKGYFKDSDLNIQDYIEKGQLIFLTSKESYMKGGSFSVEGMISLLGEETEKALKEGWDALRVTGEMSWALSGLEEPDELIRYETELNNFIPENEALAVCQYKIDDFEAEVLLNILRTHPIAIIGKNYYEDNFYYIKPEELKTEKLEKAEFPKWLENLEEWHNEKDKLLESERKYRNLFKTSKDAVFVTTEEGEWVEANPAAVKMFGFESMEELMNEPVLERYAYPEDRKKHLDEIKKNGYAENVHINLRKKDGSTFRAVLTSSTIENSEGEVVGYQGTIRDITEEEERKEKIEALHQVAIKLAEIESEQEIYEIGIMAAREILNFDICLFFEADGKKLVTKATSESVPSKRSDDMDIDEGIAGKAFHTKRSYLVKNIQEYPDAEPSSERYLSGITVPLGDFGIFQAASEEFETYNEEDLEMAELLMAHISNAIERVKYQEVLELREKALDSALNAFAIGNSDGYVVYVNRAFLRLMGYKKSEEVFGKRSLIFFRHTDEARNILDTLDKKERYRGEVRAKRKDGSELWVEALVSLVDVGDENSPYMIGSFIDITERKKAEQALRESEEKYRTVVEKSNDGIFVCQNGHLLFYNQIIKEITGYSDRELKGMDIGKFIHPDDRDRVVSYMNGRRKEGEIPEIYSAKILTKSGDTRLCEFSVKDITYEGEYAVLGIIRDITEIQKLEEEKSKMDKLQSLGILAGGIAHDFNNLLTGILGNISLARNKVDSDSELYSILEDSMKAATSAKSLTGQLLTFSKGGIPVEKEAVSLKELIKSSADFILSGSNVKYELESKEEITTVEVEKDKINRVINNIIINADQAMPEGGKIHIRCRSAEVGSKDNLPLEKGRYVIVEFEDEGIGIPEEQMDKIFDPFFTTKHEGSGLGLATAFSVVEKHGGFIDVESELGKGTIIKVYLPASSEHKIKEESTKGRGRDDGKVDGLILIMDDEAIIRSSTRRILEDSGFDVVTVRDGEEAIQEYRNKMNSGKPYDLVILDLTISGGMGGRKTMEKLREIDSNVRAIVTSGYTEDNVVTNYRKFGFQGAIEKPFEYDELVGRIRKILNK